MHTDRSWRYFVYIAVTLMIFQIFHFQPTFTLEYKGPYGMFYNSTTRPEKNPNRLRLWLTISARNRSLEISWKNAPIHKDDRIFLTKTEALSFKKERRNNMDIPEQPRNSWVSNNGLYDVVLAIHPKQKSKWLTTGVPFDYALSENVNRNTSCYGFWASYINGNGAILAQTCIRAYPRWMRDLSSSNKAIGDMRIRDLFIPGTHDSGSYRPDFDPLQDETPVTRYALTQDDDIRGQLMHGARYLDIRVAYYPETPEKFFINHAVTRQRPLIEVIKQVKQFVLETNEIVVFGMKEFPIGFGKGISVHRLLVNYLVKQFGYKIIVHPSLKWSASLNIIWKRRQYVILAYDIPEVVRAFPQTLFGSVQQRWGDLQRWRFLEHYLRTINTFDVARLSSRPVADMAELTPDIWGIFINRYGGLRKMSDETNRRVSQLYRDELGEHANIVAVDFLRGTTLVETAIDWNNRKNTSLSSTLSRKCRIGEF